MKKQISVFFLILATACGSAMVRNADDVRCRFDPSVDNLDDFINGFCGPDAYRVTAIGVPKPSERDKKIRSEQAITAAVLMARVKLYESFWGWCIEQSMQGFPEDYPKKKREWESGIRELVKKGEIIHSICGESGNCAVIYELRKKGLKKMIDACYR